MLEQTKFIGTNQAVADHDGSLTDMQLIIKDNAELVQIGMRNGEPVEEKYMAPAEYNKAKDQGLMPKQEYWGVHRAVLLLNERREQHKREAIERRELEKEATDSLVKETEK